MGEASGFPLVPQGGGQYHESPMRTPWDDSTDELPFPSDATTALVPVER
jgi:hypothetical protein